MRTNIDNASIGIRIWEESVVPVLLSKFTFEEVNKGEYRMIIGNNIVLTACTGMGEIVCVLYRDLPRTANKRNANDMQVFKKEKKMDLIYITRLDKLVKTIKHVISNPFW
jgi:hypothetical protein